MSEPNHLSSTRAVYDHSADLYVEAVGTEVCPEFEAPLDRAVLAAFAESLTAQEPGPVLDLGCGPGRIAGYLADQGLDSSGVDISPRMVEAARVAHPALHFATAPLTDLPHDDGSLAGAAYWYSIIATPPDVLSEVWSELDRVLRQDGQVLVAFQAGQGQAVEKPDAYGSPETLTLYRHDVDQVATSLQDAGFDVRADIRRQPTLGHESNVQAFLLVSRG